VQPRQAACEDDEIDQKGEHEKQGEQHRQRRLKLARANPGDAEGPLEQKDHWPLHELGRGSRAATDIEGNRDRAGKPAP